MSTLISFLSHHILPLIIDARTSREIWTTSERALASFWHQYHGSPLCRTRIKQGDGSVTTYLQHAKNLFYQLGATGRPLFPMDFNLYVFKGFIIEFRDTVTRSSSRPEPVSYAELHCLFLAHEFLHSHHVPHVHTSEAPKTSAQLIANMTQRSNGLP